MRKKSFFIVEKIKKYRKCPAQDLVTNDPFGLEMSFSHLFYVEKTLDNLAMWFSTFDIQAC